MCVCVCVCPERANFIQLTLVVSWMKLRAKLYVGRPCHPNQEWCLNAVSAFEHFLLVRAVFNYVITACSFISVHPLLSTYEAAE